MSADPQAGREFQSGTRGYRGLWRYDARSSRGFFGGLIKWKQTNKKKTRDKSARTVTSQLKPMIWRCAKLSRATGRTAAINLRRVHTTSRSTAAATIRWRTKDRC